MKKTSLLISLFISLFIVPSAFAIFGIRAGLGQFVPEDSTIKDSYANAYTADLRFHLTEPFFITGGAVFYNVHSATLPVTVPASAEDDLHIGSYKHRVDAFGVFAGVGIGKFIGKGGTGVYPYACAAAGFISPVVSQRVEYYTGDDTTTTLYQTETQKRRKWAFLLNPYAGVEFRIIGIGVFAQVDYLWGNSVEYDPVEIEGFEIFPGGELTPAGWLVYIGIVIE
ncbi:hypothetical protein DRQ36_09745 [bacterium]|nr:MAG: hypothetical protein DRQ36_09745 [bacterium]